MPRFDNVKTSVDLRINLFRKGVKKEERKEEDIFITVIPCGIEFCSIALRHGEYKTQDFAFGYPRESSNTILDS